MNENEISGAVRALAENERVKEALSEAERSSEETLAVQKELVLIEAPSWHEEKRAARYAELLRESGLEDVRIDSHNNVFGFIRGSGRTGKTVLLEAHLDTVFAFGSVKEVVTDEDGIVHAPGICDDTRALAANLSVLRAWKKAGLVPVHDIMIAGTSCEEGLGAMNGMRTLLAEQADANFIASVSIDGPGAENFYANATGMADLVAEFRGPGGHAWLKHGTPSAVQAAARAAAAIADFEVPEDPKTTFTVSLIDGGQAVHGIAERAKFTVNTRSNSQAELEALNRRVRAACRSGAEEENCRWGAEGAVTVEITQVLDIPAGSQAPDAPVIALAKACTRAVGAEPVLKKGGCTNTNMALARGIPAVTLGRGGREFGGHTMQEWFDPKGVWKCEQKSILMLAAAAGVTGETDPVPLV